MGGLFVPYDARPTYDHPMRATRGAAAALIALLLVATAGCGQRSARSPSREVTAASQTPSADGDGDRVPPGLSTSPKPEKSGPKARATKVVPKPKADHQLFGADASWPQCPKGMGIPEKQTEGRPMPTDAAEFVVLGLTNGPSFVANPCLASQVQWVKDRHLLAAAYSVVSFPDRHTLAELGDQGPFPGDTRLGALRNVGYQAALYNIATMRRAGLQSPVLWIDVEPVVGFDWSTDLEANAAVVQGVARGYRDGGFRIGFYSLASLWSRVVGGLRFGAPEWRPAGTRGLAEARNRCGEDWSFQGGPAVLGQWIEDGRDRNIACPGAVPDPAAWFHQY
jgi:hypothetical protein